ncbi:MAG: transcription-repair coupling factor [Deltaproteobacteria bacterium]|jgi:transcription-repair coupling factor (superfamily II helicase)|nr:transcription-repair coupling factor [Deltaproteobacteria bacterium]
MLPDSLTDILPGDGSKVSLYGLSLPAFARKLSQLLSGPWAGKRLMVVTPTAVEAEDLVGDLGFFWPEGRSVALAGLELSPFIGQIAGAAPVAERLGALALLAGAAGAPAGAVVVASMASAARLAPSKEALLSRTMTISPGEETGFEALKGHLELNGYRRVAQVESAADYAVRGGIIDVFPGGAERPVRLDFFGDFVEAVKTFKVSDQRSAGKLSKVAIPPASEGALGPKERERAAEALAELSKKRGWLGLLWEPIAKQFRDGGAVEERDNWSPLFSPEARPITDYLGPGGAQAVVFEPERALEAGRKAWLSLTGHFERLRREARPHMPLGSLYKDPECLREAFEALPAGYIASRALAIEDGQKGRSYHFACEDNSDLRAMMSVPRRATGLLGPLAARLRALLARGLSVRLVMRTGEQTKRLAEMLAEYDLRPEVIVPAKRGSLSFEVGQLSGGFVAPYDSEAIITEDEIFGNRQRLRRRAKEEFRGLKGFSGIQDLSLGDYVVHVEHGIGQYLGLVALTLSSGQRGDFLHLAYKGGDILYVPVERFKSVSKYVGPSDKAPGLDRLGGASWEKIKGQVKESIREMAEELLKLYAARQTTPGFSFSPRDQAMMEFEAAFEYDPTPDQERAIDEVLKDLSTPKPMDRLVCGDVGYGKTEVAMRAAFKVVSDGKQVAVLVPTTILAEQHEKSFSERLKDWPVLVESLSRFRRPSEQREIVKRLFEGKVDILIGTHRILQQDVIFKDLGLVVVDEEHRFGVAHKERLKKLRTEVDYLSMSATPIPRSLSMSMNGIRDMSLIETSPQDRLAVRTAVMRSGEEAIREAVEFELSRGGQVFFIHNRVKDIGLVLRRLTELMPLVRFGVAHGQMSSAELEKSMRSFLRHEIDVWLCTAIVESGLDFPAANTIIIDKADTFGLAQLYQLRGRVGRGHVQAYAYLLVDNPETLTADARKRLKALMDHTDLGSGYQIALHDLQIRGSGNILGEAQSGQVFLVGYEMYAQLVEQTIRELKNEPFAEDYDPEVVVGLSAYLPEKYAPDTELRLVLYRRLSSAGTDEELSEIAAEMVDRFGPIPLETMNLLDLMAVKILLRKARARRLEGSEEFMTLTFGPEGPSSYEKVMALVTGGAKRRNRLTPQGKLIVGKAEYSGGERPLEGIKELLARII